MTTLEPGLYVLRHVQGFIHKGPLLATAMGDEQPIKVEQKTAQFQSKQTVRPPGSLFLLLLV